MGKFIPRHSFIAKPLTDLLKRDMKFEIVMNELEAISKLKDVLSNDPVLKLFRAEAGTEVHIDASCSRYEVILMQKGSEDVKSDPVYHASGKTVPAVSKYASYELEVLAIVEASRKFRVY